MLEHFFHSRLALGLAESAVTFAVALLVMLLARQRAAGLLKDLPLAMLRGMVQIVIVGAVLAIMLHARQWTSVLALIAMMLAASSIVRRRVRKIPGSFALALISICAGAGTILAIMVSVGVIPWTISMLVPVGSMVIANTMNTQSLFLERLHGEVIAHTGEIESALALGAAPETALLPYLRAAFRACLIPSVDNIRSLGIVWIPGIMAGMVLSGEPPLYAAFYQFVVLTTIFSASALTCFVSSHLVGHRIFSAQEQLLLQA